MSDKNQIPAQRVNIVYADIGIWELALFMVKVAIAAIPAMLILALFFTFFGSVFRAM